MKKSLCCVMGVPCPSDERHNETLLDHNPSDLCGVCPTRPGIELDRRLP